MKTHLRIWVMMAALAAVGALAFVSWRFTAMTPGGITVAPRTSGSVDIADLRGLLGGTNFQMFDLETREDICLTVAVFQDVDGEKRGEVEGQYLSSRFWPCLEAGRHRVIVAGRRDDDRFTVTVSLHDAIGNQHTSQSITDDIPAEFQSMETSTARHLDLTSGEVTLISWRLTENGDPGPGSREFIVRIEKVESRTASDTELEQGFR